MSEVFYFYTMPKICQVEECTNYIFGKGYCRFHQNKRTDKNTKRINPFSDKHLDALKVYKIVRLEFIVHNRFCQAKMKGCTKDATQVHHICGRIGDKLTDSKNFLAVCHSCHCYIENHPEIAKELGFTKDRY